VIDLTDLQIWADYLEEQEQNSSCVRALVARLHGARPPFVAVKTGPMRFGYGDGYGNGEGDGSGIVYRCGDGGNGGVIYGDGTGDGAGAGDISAIDLEGDTNGDGFGDGTGYGEGNGDGRGAAD
jgi:hypothetical protein